MEGKGLRQIIDSSINYKLKNGGSVRIAWEEHQFDGSRLHRNATYNEVLDAIESIILFRISNYFLRFSNDFKRKTGADQFPNDCYEYVEYGTDNPITTGLQRLGFSRVPAHPRRPRLLHRQRHQPGASQPTYPQLRKPPKCAWGQGKSNTTFPSSCSQTIKGRCQNSSISKLSKIVNAATTLTKVRDALG